jgi:hypothetical protein
MSRYRGILKTSGIRLPIAFAEGEPKASNGEPPTMMTIFPHSQGPRPAGARGEAELGWCEIFEWHEQKKERKNTHFKKSETTKTQAKHPQKPICV